MVHIVGTWTVEGGLVRDKTYNRSEMSKLYRIGEMPVYGPHSGNLDSGRGLGQGQDLQVQRDEEALQNR